MGSGSIFFFASAFGGTASSNGDADLTWQNHTDDESAIKILNKTPRGWETIATLPPGTTSFHLPAE